MKNKVFMLTVLALMLAGCGKKDEIKEVEVTRQSALEMYKDAKRVLDAEAWSLAVDRYKKLRSHYPFGHYTEQGTIELAYAQYKSYKMEEAVTTVERFIRNYPAHENLDYAYYLKGLIYFESDRGLIQKLRPDQMADRNQENVKNAFLAFKNFIERYPDSPYAPDARQRMIYLKNQLAYFELNVGKYYLRRGAPVAALNRAKFVIESFNNTPAVPDALALMIASYEMIDDADLAQQTRTLLQSNYPEHPYLRNGKLDLSTSLISWKDFWPF